jgi:peptidoglycan/LPS O-acetylase OafA/YrhL
VKIKTLKLLGCIAGITLIACGVSRILFSIAAVPGGGAVNPTVDNESRAAGALLITFGLAYIWAMRRSPMPSALLRTLAMTMALIAVARVISMIETGLPHWIFTVFTVVEFIAAVLTYWYSTLEDDQSAATPPAQASGLRG